MKKKKFGKEYFIQLEQGETLTAIRPYLDAIASRVSQSNNHAYLSYDAAGGFVYFEDADALLFYVRMAHPHMPHLPEVGKLGFFGGIIEEGESPLDAAKREMREELINVGTGAPFEPGELELFGIWIDDQGRRKYMYTCRVHGSPHLKLGPEGRDLVLLRRTEALDADFAFGYASLVRLWLREHPPSA